MRICSVPSCDRAHKAKGYCTAHYYRVQRHGDPLERIPIRGGRRKGDPSDPDVSTPGDSHP